jgi:hypothetical protein
LRICPEKNGLTEKAYFWVDMKGCGFVISHCSGTFHDVGSCWLLLQVTELYPTANQQETGCSASSILGCLSESRIGKILYFTNLEHQTPVDYCAGHPWNCVLTQLNFVK